LAAVEPRLGHGPNLGLALRRRSKKKTIMFPGHMTVSEVMLCSRLAGRAGWPDMKNYWQNVDDGVAGKPAGPPERA